MAAQRQVTLLLNIQPGQVGNGLGNMLRGVPSSNLTTNTAVQGLMANFKAIEEGINKLTLAARPENIAATAEQLVRMEAAQTKYAVALKAAKDQLAPTLTLHKSLGEKIGPVIKELGLVAGVFGGPMGRAGALVGAVAGAAGGGPGAVAGVTGAVLGLVSEVGGKLMEWFHTIKSFVFESVAAFSPVTVEMFDTAMRDLMAVFGQMFVPIVKEATVLVRKIADGFLNLSPQAREFINVFFTGPIIAVLKYLTDQTYRLVGAFELLARDMLALNDQTHMATIAIVTLTGALDVMAFSIEFNIALMMVMGELAQKFTAGNWGASMEILGTFSQRIVAIIAQMRTLGRADQGKSSVGMSGFQAGFIGAEEVSRRAAIEALRQGKADPADRTANAAETTARNTGRIAQAVEQGNDPHSARAANQGQYGFGLGGI